MPHKCFLCPKKPATLLDDAIHCAGCGSYYHPACAKRGKPNEDNIFKVCCEEAKQSDDIDPENAADLGDLDVSAKALYKLLSKKIDDNYKNIIGSINNIKRKIVCIEERLDTIEDNALLVTEDIIAEIQDRNAREKNIMIYNSKDSNNAEASDKQMVSELLLSSNEVPPFNIDDIVVSRMGNKFINNSNRPLKVTLPSKENVHWVFHNKKALCKGDIGISADLTRQQRTYRSSVIKELKSRKEKGEEGLFIKYVRGVPTITVDKSVKKKTAPVATNA